MAHGDWWRECLRPMSKDKKMWLCPTARTHRGNPDLNAMALATNPFEAWRVPLSHGGDVGSFGPNGWMCNPLPHLSSLWGRGPKEDYWRTHMIPGAHNVPVFTEGWWVDGWPRHTNDPPPWGYERPPINGHEMQTLCVNRHGGAQFCMFADWSVRKVALKQLWTLKWHRNFDTAGVWTKIGGVQPADWPEWMRGLKDEF
jgi:hypothetical protein